MTDDKYKVLGWLLGRGDDTSTIRDDERRRFEQHIGEKGAKAALRQLLSAPEPLDGDGLCS